MAERLRVLSLLTNKVWLQQILTAPEQSVGKHPVDAAEEKVIGVDQVVTDGRKVACTTKTPQTLQEKQKHYKKSRNITSPYKNIQTVNVVLTITTLKQ
jgi:hypothetical protein